MDHISVCICTFKRPALLTRLLQELKVQVTKRLFTFSVVLVDNDRNESARGVFRAFKAESDIPIDYYVVPEQNIALARNKAVQSATGNFVAFIDDDEIPIHEWIINLYRTCQQFGADAVLGPVIPSYEPTTPHWVVKGKFYERPTHKTGTVLDWTKTRTGNVLLRKKIFESAENLFRPEFGMGGEDRELFRRVISQGYRFVWCAEAPVRELVPMVRCTRSFMIRRALLRGTIPQFGYRDIFKSLMAVPLYTAALPVLAFLGQHRFMRVVVKDFDHLGRLLAFCRLRVIKDKYILE